MLVAQLACAVVLLSASQEPRKASELDVQKVSAATAAPSESEWSWSVSAVTHHFFEVDFDDGVPGNLSLGQADVRFELGRKLDEKRSLGLFWKLEQSRYDFETPAGDLFDDVFDDVYRGIFAATLVTRESEDFSWLTTVNASVAGESGAHLGDAVTFGGGLTFTFRAFSDFLFTLGGFGNTRLEDDPLVYPWFQVDWQPSERIHVGQEGSGYGIGYEWLENTRAYASFSFVERNYRLDGTITDGATTITDGVARDDEFALNVGLIWEYPHYEVELYGGAAIREITLLDDDDEIDDRITEAGPYFAVRWTWSP